MSRATSRQEQAHKAWLEIFGDEMLPQFGSDADWTEWVKQQRANEEEEIRKQLAGGELRLCEPRAPIAQPSSRPSSARRPPSEPEASVAAAGGDASERLGGAGWCTAMRLRMQEMQDGVGGDDATMDASAEMGPAAEILSAASKAHATSSVLSRDAPAPAVLPPPTVAVTVPAAAAAVAPAALDAHATATAAIPAITSTVRADGDAPSTSSSLRAPSTSSSLRAPSVTAAPRPASTHRLSWSPQLTPQLEGTPNAELLSLSPASLAASLAAAEMASPSPNCEVAMGWSASHRVPSSDRKKASSAQPSSTC